MSTIGLPAAAIAAFTDRALVHLQSVAPDLSGQIRLLRARTVEAPRILFTGGAGTGVSTLVRAIAGAGARDEGAGPVLWCAADRPVPVDVPAGIRVRQVAGAALQNLTLIDGAGASPEVAACADAAVYLVDREPSVADRRQLRELGFGPAGTALVVSRADEFGAGSFGSADPVADARGYARALAEETVSWATSVAVSPLLAAAGGGADDAVGSAELADRLARYQSPAVAAGLLATDIPPAVLADLQLVGTYGVLHGGANADDLDRWLTGISGIDRLRMVLLGGLSQAALLRRAALVLDEVSQLRFRTSDPSIFGEVLDRHGSSPEAWRIRLFPYIARLAEAGMDIEAALVTRVVDADGLHDLAQITTGAPRVEVLNGLREQLRTVNLQLTGFTVPVVEAALTAISAVFRRAIDELEAGDHGGGVTDGSGSLFQ